MRIEPTIVLPPTQAFSRHSAENLVLILTTTRDRSAELIAVIARENRRSTNRPTEPGWNPAASIRVVCTAR